MKTCIVCGSDDIYKDRFRDEDRYKCATCGFERLDIEVDDDYYDEEYMEGDSDYSAFEAVTYDDKLDAGKVWLMGQLVNGLNIQPDKTYRVLEIGPSTSGGLLKFFDTMPNVERYAVEISQHASRVLRKKGIEVYNGTLEEFKTDKKFDLVLTTEVIEHVEDPKLFLQKAYGLLKTDGELLVSTGNKRSLVAKVQGENWRYYEVPVHINYFDHVNLNKLLHEVGFANTSVTKMGFSWLNHLCRFKLGAFVGLVGKVPITTGMYIRAKTR